MVQQDKKSKRAKKQVLRHFSAAHQIAPSPFYDFPTVCDHGPDHWTAKLHRYTACYLPELAARLIRKHSRPGETVLDSFLGGGTTVIQAVANERIGLGLDVHPAAVEIASARIAPVYPAALTTATERIRNVLRHGRMRKVDLPEVWDWERWFPKGSHPALTQLRRTILDIPRADVRRLLLVGTAGALKPVSYWYSRATKLQFDPKKKPLDARSAMLARLDEIEQINQALWKHVDGRAGAMARREAATLQVADCRELPLESDSTDLAVSSPPYFIAYDYAQLIRLSSWWILGNVPDGKGHLESGGRGKSVIDKAPDELGLVFAGMFRRARQRFDAGGEGWSMSRVSELLRQSVPFFDGIRSALSELHRVIRPDGKLCFVLGNTRYCGITVPTAEISTELALRQGFRIVAIHVRRQHSATQPQARDDWGQFTSDDSPSQYSYRDEYVIVLRRQ